MNPPDVFATFLDDVASSLDEPGTTGRELADRAHLSRFHFDRVITAVAGESPSALRRRLLLERAAYQLASTSSTILDIAIEAGFGSHEAFTRAFSRAYGLAPKVWRQRASHRFFLEAPSGVHFHPPAGLRLPARRKVNGMDVLVKMVEHHVWLVGELISRSEALDASAVDRPLAAAVPDEEPITIRRQLDRMVWQLEMWLAAVADEPFTFPESGRAVSLAQLKDRYEVVGPRFAELARSLNDEGRFDETFVDSTCQPPHVFTYGGMIAHVLTFSAMRRMVVVDALRGVGVNDLGWGDPMHFVAADGAA